MLAASTPPRLAERSRSGEFVDFSDLLPQVSGGYAGSTHSDTTMHFKMLSGGPLRLVPDGTRSRNRHVCDSATWSEAFVMYMHTILQTALHRALELLSFQGLILLLKLTGASHVKDVWTTTASFDRQPPAILGCVGTTSTPTSGN